MPRLSIETLPRICAGRDAAEQSWKHHPFWLAVQNVLAFTLEQMTGDRRTELEEQAQALRAEYEAIFPLLDRACAATCPWCPTPCCLVADARFDMKDLLFIHLARVPAPLRQPRGDGHATCRYLGPSGCLLPRISRPWICTWYLCPMQKQWFFSYDKDGYRQLSRAIENIKKKRNKVELRYIRVSMIGGRIKKRPVLSHRAQGAIFDLSDD